MRAELLKSSILLLKKLCGRQTVNCSETRATLILDRYLIQIIQQKVIRMKKTVVKIFSIFKTQGLYLMKNLLLFRGLVFVILILQNCTVITTESKPYSKVVNVENATKNELYVRANNWMISAFNNAESVIQFSDKESGTITGRYLLGTVTEADQYGPAERAFATIQIKVKDGASKITITPDSFKYRKGNIYTLYTEEKAKDDINALLTSFEQKIKLKEDNDW